MNNIEFESKNYDLTSIEETQKILFDINKEIFDIINEVASESNCSVILNNPVSHFSNDFPFKYNDRSAFSSKHSNMYSESYFQFILGAESSKDEYTLPSSSYLSNWLEDSRNPETISYLPSTPQTFVFIGAKDILLDVLKKIYSKYNRSAEAYKKVEEAVKILKKEEASLYMKGY